MAILREQEIGRKRVRLLILLAALALLLSAYLWKWTNSADAGLRAKLDRIQIGKLGGDVRRILGPPVKMAAESSPEKLALGSPCWEWDCTDAYVMIDFDAGEV